jgi:nucleoside-diphosphate-sugar epimerase
VFGDGSQTRSLCYVDDLFEGMMRMMDAPDAFIGPVNLGNPGEFTILELAEKVIRTTGSRSKIIFQLLPQDDPLQRILRSVIDECSRGRRAKLRKTLTGWKFVTIKNLNPALMRLAGLASIALV